MLDPKEIQKRVRAQVFGHWSVLGPLAVSAVPFSYGMFIADDWKVSVFGGIVLVCGSIGAYAYRFLFKRNEIIDNEVEKVRRNIVDSQQSKLDDLLRKLESDGNSRDEQLFIDLRNIRDTFNSDETWKEGLDQVIVAEILNKIQGLFSNAIKQLEKSFDLRQASYRLPKVAQKDMIKTADNMLDRVEQALEELGRYYALAQEQCAKRMTKAGTNGKALSQDVDELRNLFDVAERAEDRLQGGTSESDAEYLRTFSDKSV